MSDNRALSAALSGPVFHGAASRSALHASDRHVERWAPEGEGATRGGGMRSLAFADRVVSPWMAGSNSAASRMFSSYASSGTRDRSAPEVSWLFPRPWFQDELDWMAAARYGLEETPRASALTTRGTFMRTREAGDTAWSQVAMPVLAPPVMATVAPSMRPSALPEPGPLAAARMWSPSVPFAAAAAAEVVAGAMRSVEASGLPGVAERSPIWSGLAVVRPSELAPSPISIPAASTPAMSSAPTAFTASLTAAPRISQISQVAAVDAARASIERIDARVDVMRASALPTATEALAPSTDGAPSVESSGSLSPAEHRLADAAHGSSQASAALRTVELLLAAVAERTSRTAAASSAAPSAAAGASPAIASSGPIAEAARAAEQGRVAEQARASEAAAANFAPIVGPRVAMPAGLGGLVTSMETAQAVARPMLQREPMTSSPFAMPLAAFQSSAVAGFQSSAVAGLPSSAAAGLQSSAAAGFEPSAAASGGTFAPVWAARPASALAAVAAAPVRGVDHLTWSDRWLARFAGASPVALQSFDNGAESIAPSLRTLSVGAPEIVYVHPTLGPAAIAATAARSPVVAPLAERARPTIAAPRPSAPLRIDDGEAVPDAVFAAIAAAAAAPAPRGPSAPTPVGAQPSTPTSVRETVRETPRETAPVMAPVMAPVDLVAARGPASVADLAAISVPTAPDAGLASGLASSPMAAALAAVMPMTSAPVFDPRALRGAAVAEAYLGGLLARAASPVGVLTGAPTMMNLAAAGVSPAGMSLDGTGLGGAQAAPDESASMRWSLRDLALAPVQLRLAAAAPDRTFVALGGDVPITLRASRADAAAQQAANVGPRALPAAAWAMSPAALAAMQTAAAASASGGASSAALVGPAETGGMPRTDVRPHAAELVAERAAVERAAVERAAVEQAAVTQSTERAAVEQAAVQQAAVQQAAAQQAAVEQAAAHAAEQHAGRAVVERELLGLRSALLASPTSAAAVPLAHAAHAPLVSSTTSVPSLDLPFALPALAGVGQSTTSPLGAAMARHAATQFAGNAGNQFAGNQFAATQFAAGVPFAAGEAAHGAEDLGAPASSRVAALAGAMPVVALEGREVTPRLHAPSLAVGRPGSLAESALAWSIGESRVAGGLSYDFVTPEMVLAARVYGLPAGAAAEAMRVAAGGPSAMASLAASLDLTFLRAFQGPVQGAAQGPGAAPAPTRAAAATSAVPALAPSAVDAGSDAAPGASSTPTPMPAVERTAAEAAGFDPSMDPGLVWAAGTPGMWPARGGAALGGVGRAPRGAYLWPSATAAALGLNAMSPEGAAGLPVVALELLAAQAVAELGTWVTAFPRGDGAIEAMIAAGGAGAGPRAAALAAMSGATAVGATGAPTALPAAAPGGAAPVAGLARAPGVESAASDDYAEAAETAAAWSMPALARQRFESVYVALARSAEGQSLSPSARAARAMSLLTRGDGETRTTRQLAAEAWTVLPHVYRGDLDLVAGEAARAGDVEAGLGESRPGLAGLAARAGDLLGSFVHPSMAEVRSAGGAEPMRGPASRVEAPIYVENAPAPRPAPAAGFTGSRPGRTFTQFGGGEVEVPAWFEAAAEKMFSGSGDDRAAATLAQMVLVTSMPQQQIAAATKGGSTSGGGGGAPQQGGGKQGGVEKPDIERLAHEVYQEVMALLELTRIRSGDPFQ
jgi:hypothetical protein